MTFLEPQRLWFLLLVPALVALYVGLQYRKSHYAVRFTNMALLDTVAPRRVNWRQHVAVLLALLTLGFAIVLFARPTDIVKVPRQTGVTVVLTMDVSLSMEAADVNPDRITAAKQTAKEFLTQLPPAFKVSVVSFARYSEVVVPPTVDRVKVTRAIEDLQLSEYTATGEGIFSALDVVKQSLGTADTPSGKLPAMIVLISDGARTVGRSQVSAANAAKDEGVPVYTVALGTESGTITNQGETVAVPVEIEQLQQIADISGGKAYVAESPDDLLNAYEDVDGRLVYSYERQDATSQYMGYLVLLSLLSTAAGLFVASRWP
ncbi:MAG: VWA domain-containing protein [Propionibacteriales bacterium]|nr:VWA domain-containing protein [Propionibacteriales bacterium]